MCVYTHIYIHAYIHVYLDHVPLLGRQLLKGDVVGRHGARGLNLPQLEWRHRHGGALVGGGAPPVVLKRYTEGRGCVRKGRVLRCLFEKGVDWGDLERHTERAWLREKRACFTFETRVCLRRARMGVTWNTEGRGCV